MWCDWPGFTSCRVCLSAFLSKPYSLEVTNDQTEVFGVHRHNHGLAYSLRCCAYVPHVVSALQLDADFYDPSLIEFLQICMVFLVVGRQNEVTWSAEDSTLYDFFHENSADAFAGFVNDAGLSAEKGNVAESQGVDFKSLVQFCLDPSSKEYNHPCYKVARLCHNLDLLRCYDGDVNPLSELDHAPAHQRVLVQYAEKCLQATGNRILASSCHGHSVSPQKYQKNVFVECSTDPLACFRKINAVAIPHLVEGSYRLFDENGALHNENPVAGLWKMPAVSIKEAVKKACSVKELKFSDFDVYLHLAAKKAQEVGQYYNNDPLSADEVASIHLYTQETGLYRTLNSALRSENREMLKPFFPYLRLLLSGLQKLRPLSETVYRGVPGDMSAKYTKGEEIIWWGLSSATATLDVVQNFLGDKQSTLFTIKVT